MKNLDISIRETDSQRKRRRAVSAAELYDVLETLLPFARVEIECLEGYVKSFPDDPDHAQDAERVRRGQATLAMAGRLIERKSYAIRRQQQALRPVFRTSPVQYPRITDGMPDQPL
jgi:hypothetical protein